MKKYYWESAGIPVAKLGDMENYTGVDGITTSGIALDSKSNMLQMMSASYIGTIDHEQWTKS